MLNKSDFLFNQDKMKRNIRLSIIRIARLMLENLHSLYALVDLSAKSHIKLLVTRIPSLQTTRSDTVYFSQCRFVVGCTEKREVCIECQRTHFRSGVWHTSGHSVESGPLQYMRAVYERSVDVWILFALFS